MEDRIRLSYFYGKEADQFSFYKIIIYRRVFQKNISGGKGVVRTDAG